MATFNTSVFVFDEGPTLAGGGPFTTRTLNGLIAGIQPAFAAYNVTTMGTATGGTVAGQGGSISVIG